MWSKISKGIQSLLNHKSGSKVEEGTVNSPLKLIDMAIEELEKAIQKNKESQKKIIEQQNQVQQQLNEYSQKSEDLYDKAKRSLQNKQEAAANQFLSQKVDVETQAAQYQGIFLQIVQTLRQLQQQADNLNLKLVETKSKKNLLITREENAQTNKELAKFLNDLDQDGELSNWERNIMQAEMEGQSEDELLKREIDALGTPNLAASLQEEMKREEEEKKAKAEADKMKKIELLFNQLKGKEQEQEKKNTLVEKDNKEDLLKKFFEKEVEKKPEKDFFSEPPTQEDKAKNKLNIDDFFQDPDKQKNIDDFFKD